MVKLTGNHLNAQLSDVLCSVLIEFILRTVSVQAPNLKNKSPIARAYTASTTDNNNSCVCMAFNTGNKVLYSNPVGTLSGVQRKKHNTSLYKITADIN